jgi:hypothetical protein
MLQAIELLVKLDLRIDDTTAAESVKSIKLGSIFGGVCTRVID